MAVLEVNGLCKSYASFQLKDVSFALDAGRIMGFIGRNGAGKTTTLKSILHIVHPDSGSIRFSVSRLMETNRRSRAKSALPVVLSTIIREGKLRI